MQNYSLVLQPGEKWSARIGRNRTIRFTALGPAANLAILMYNSRDTGERLNIPDSLKSQHTAKLTYGNVLYTEMGRVIASVVEDSLGWHDPIGGLIHRDQVDTRYGTTRFQEQRNERLASGYENMLVELGKYGLGKRDIVPNANLFSKVWASEDGSLHWDPTHCPADATVALRTEMETLLLLSNTPHPLDPRSGYPQSAIRLDIAPCAPALPDDYCRNYRPENQRGFENTELYHFLLD